MDSSRRTRRRLVSGPVELSATSFNHLKPNRLTCMRSFLPSALVFVPEPYKTCGLAATELAVSPSSGPVTRQARSGALVPEPASRHPLVEVSTLPQVRAAHDYQLDPIIVRPIQVPQATRAAAGLSSWNQGPPPELPSHYTTLWASLEHRGGGYHQNGRWPSTQPGAPGQLSQDRPEARRPQDLQNLQGAHRHLLPRRPVRQVYPVGVSSPGRTPPMSPRRPADYAVTCTRAKPRARNMSASRRGPRPGTQDRLSMRLSSKNSSRPTSASRLGHLGPRTGSSSGSRFLSGSAAKSFWSSTGTPTARP